MKKLFPLLIGLLLCAAIGSAKGPGPGDTSATSEYNPSAEELAYLRAIFAPGDSCNPTPCRKFRGPEASDKFQIYAAIKYKFPSTTAADSCTPAVCRAFVHPDNYMIYAAIKGINLSSLSGSAWNLTGNAITADKSMGSTTAKSVIFISNNIERFRMKSDGKLRFTSSIYAADDVLSVDVNNRSLADASGVTAFSYADRRLYRSDNELTLDYENRILWYSSALKCLDFASFLLYDTQNPQKISINFGARMMYANSQAECLDYSGDFLKFKGTSICDVSAFGGNHLRIAGDPDGTTGNGIKLFAYSPTGGIGWVSGLEYKNVASGRPILELQPGGGSVQIGAGTPDASSIVEITSTTQLFRITPMTAAQANAITPAEGSLVMVSTTNGTFPAVGLYLYVSGAWTQL